jgi:hypothetical protein
MVSIQSLRIELSLDISGVHLKLLLKSRLLTHHSSVCTVKTQTHKQRQKVRLDLNS